MISTGFSILLLYWYGQIVVQIDYCVIVLVIVVAYSISSVFVCRFILNDQLNVAGGFSKLLIYFMKIMTWNWCSQLFTFCFCHLTTWFHLLTGEETSFGKEWTSCCQDLSIWGVWNKLKMNFRLFIKLRFPFSYLVVLNL